MIDNAPTQNAEWMTEQLLTFLGSDSLFDETLGPLKDRIILVVDPERAGEEKPRYNIRFKSREGIYLALPDGRGGNLSWVPDWKTSPAYLRDTARNEEDGQRLETAKISRDGKS